MLLGSAETAMAAADWDAAATAWKALSRLRPDDPAGFLGHAAACRSLDLATDADAALQEFLERQPLTPEIAVSMALNAQQRADWPQALVRWRQARRDFPDFPVIWASEAAILQVLGRLADAEALIAEALERFPDNVDVTAQHHNIAMAQADWPEARRRWERFERDFPGHAHIRRDGEETRRRIAAGLAAADTRVLRGQADAADAAKDWVRSTEIWRLLYERNGNDAATILFYGRALRESGQNQAADRVLQHGITIYPENVEIRANHAEVAAARRDWPEAARRWELLLREHSDVQALWSMAATAYFEAGSFAAADTLLARAIEAEPERVDLRVHHAKFAERLQDWTAAVQRWDIAHRLAPADLNIQNSRGDAIWEETAKRLEGGEKPERAARQAPGTDMAATDAASLKRLALCFEGLGDNCEFGIVQRRLGAEPIGLFRFAAINADTLIELTRESFARLGDPAFIELRLTAGDEYLVTDTRGLYHMHSFVRKGSVDENKFLRQQITRLGYLRKKLVEDLQEADKIFVFKSSEQRLTDATIREMRAALSEFGDVTLLAIRKSDDRHEKGSVERLEDRILVGYVETLYNSEGNPIDFEAWRSILFTAQRHKTEFDRRLSPD